MVLLYVIGLLPGSRVLGAVKLQKLLYFIEKRSSIDLKMRGASFVTYIKHNLGSYAADWERELFYLEQANLIEINEEATLYFRPRKTYQLSPLGKEAFLIIKNAFNLACPKLVTVINAVINDFGDKDGKTLSDICHELPEYQNCEMFEVIIDGNDPNGDVYFPALQGGLFEKLEDEDELEDLIMALDEEFVNELKVALGIWKR